MKKPIIYSIAAVLLIVYTSYGSLIFSDDFNKEQCGMNETLNNWLVTYGTIDVLGSGSNGSFSDLSGGTHGYFLDLDGSNRIAGAIESYMIFKPGVYALTFNLAGSQRNDINTVHLSFGSADPSTFTLNSSVGWTTYTINATLIDAAPLKFIHEGGDCVGLLLDNVSVNLIELSSVSEPSVVSLFILGLASLFCLSSKRRK